MTLRRSSAVLGALAVVAVPTVLLSTAPAAQAASAPSYQTWQSDVRAAVSPAIPWLRERREEGGQGLSIVLDIDNTALETYYHPGHANNPVLDVARWADAHGMNVLFVTARTSSSSANAQLRAAGYPVDGICTRKHGESLGKGKARCRQDLTRDGYTITANIGNRSTDFEGGYYEKRFKLPSYGDLLD